MTFLRWLFKEFLPYRYETNRRRIFMSCAGRVRLRTSKAQPRDCDCPRCA